MTAPGSIQPLPTARNVHELLLAIVGGIPGAEPETGGSGVFIAPGVALTACHVLEAYWRCFDDRGRWKADGDGRFGLQGIQYLPGRTEPVVWHVVGAWHSDAMDIAVLQLVPDKGLPGDYRWPYATLNVWPPEVGVEVQAVGFPDVKAAYNPTTGGWVVDPVAAGSVGKVTACFPECRDRSFLRFPCFAMDLEVVNGMSGGGIFDRVGHLRGVICSGVDAGKGGPHLAYGSILWPTLGLPIHPTRYLGLSEGDTRLLNLARDGRLNVLHADRLPRDLADLTPAAFASGGDQRANA